MSKISKMTQSPQMPQMPQMPQQQADASRTRRFARRLPLVGAAAVGSVVLLAAPAFAHVSVQPHGPRPQGRLCDRQLQGAQ